MRARCSLLVRYRTAHQKRGMKENVTAWAYSTSLLLTVHISLLFGAAPAYYLFMHGFYSPCSPPVQRRELQQLPFSYLCLVSSLCVFVVIVPVLAFLSFVALGYLVRSSTRPNPHSHPHT